MSNECENCPSLIERVRELEAALEFYADESAWNQPPVRTVESPIGVAYENQASKVQRDRGRIARAALKDTNNQEGGA